MSAGIHSTSTLSLGRRERRKLEVRARILAAARELFAKHGFEATTVDEIARAADVAPATFFNHFQSKQALLSLMAGEVFETLHAMTAQHLEGPVGGHVTGPAQTPAAGRGHLGRNVGGALAVDVGDEHVDSLGRERQCTCSADPTATDAEAPGQEVHRRHAEEHGVKTVERAAMARKDRAEVLDAEVSLQHRLSQVTERRHARDRDSQGERVAQTSPRVNIL